MSNPTEQRVAAMQSEQPWLVWMWQHYSLSLESFETRDAAMEWAEYVQDRGEGSLMAVEGPEGVVSAAEWAAWSAPRREAEKQAREAEKPRPHLVWLLAPSEGAWSPVGWHETVAEAQADAAGWRVRLGDERVKVATLPDRPTS